MERWRFAVTISLILCALVVEGGCWGRNFFRMPQETLRTSSKMDSLLEENAILKERIGRLEAQLASEQEFERGTNAQLMSDIEELKDDLNALQELLRETQQSSPPRTERRRAAASDTSSSREAGRPAQGAAAGGGLGAAAPTQQGAASPGTAAGRTTQQGVSGAGANPGPPASGAPRDTAVSAGRGAPDTTAAASAQPAPEPEDVYRQIYLDYTRKEYQLALEESDAFLKEYPDDPLGEEVLFVRGSCLMELQNYFDALKEFSALVQTYPQGKRVPGALLRIAISYDTLGEKEMAAGVVRRLIKEHPKSDEAAAAKERFAALLKQ